MQRAPRVREGLAPIPGAAHGLHSPDNDSSESSMDSQNQSERTLDVRRVLSYLRDEAHGPLSLEKLAEALELTDSEHARLEELLGELTGTGKVVLTRGRYGCPEKMNLVVGRLSAHPDGFGFVVPDGDEPDVFVAGRNLGSALHGDRVVARVEHRRKSGKVEGRVIRVLERARSTVVGKVEVGPKTAWVSPIESRIPYDIQIPLDELGGAESGQLVHVELTEYPDGKRSPEGKVIEVLGDPTDPNIDVEVVIREFELPHEFPEAVLAEAAKIDVEVKPEQIEGRTDFRTVPIVTIDGESAKDFDDAVFVEMTPNGNYRLHVHIADVSHYVAPGSAIDDEALHRGTSTYFPNRVVPMLPEKISNEVCSLRPGVDRLVQSAIIEIDRGGRTVNYDFHDGVICSAARMTYREVAGILDGDEALVEKYSAHQHQFERMRDLAEILMEYRQQRGSIDFDLPEPELVIDLRGDVEDVIKAERNVAHRIIEEFMIRANEVVASHLTWEGMPTLYRVHDGPDEERIERFREFISGLGHNLGGGSSPKPKDFMELIQRLEGRPEARVISTLMLRTMKQARYQTANDGHFGLASEMYTHFTSPIRRYPDLVVHRLLRAERGSEAMPTLDVEALTGQLDSIGAACSFLERRAESAEREYVGWKKVQFMKDKLGDQFEGHITGVKSFGFFVQVEPFFVEGLVPVSTLTDDYYRYDEAKHRLAGEHNKRTFTLGDRVRISVARVDLDRRRVDFALEEGPLELPAPPAESRRRSRRGGRRRRGDEDREQRKEERQPVAAQGEQSAAERGSEESAGGDDKPKRRRRRGTRGGRKRSRSKRTDSASSEKQAAASGRQADEKGGAGKKGADRKASEKKSADTKGNGRGQSKRRDAKSSQGKRGSKKARGGRGKPRRSDSNGVLPAPAKAEPGASNKEETRDRSQPAVNPYLTEIDF
jgi:ribonuclease R